MWGEIKSISRETDFFQDYRPSDTDPSIKYEVEYLREDLVEAEENATKIGSSLDTWELRDTFETDSLGYAVRELMIRLFDEKTADVWFFLTAGDKEICMDIPTDIRTTIRQMVNAEMRSTNDRLSEANDELEKELSLYREFVKKYNAEQMFQDFKKERL